MHYYKCDVTDFDALQSLTAEIKRTHGNPSVLINNAGIGKLTLSDHDRDNDLTNAIPANGKIVHDLSAAQVDRLFKVNITSHFVLIKEFLPGMLASRKGHIVTIASMASFVAPPGLLDYACTKVAALYLNDGKSRPCFVVVVAAQQKSTLTQT